MAFDFCIEYKNGVENKVVDALSRKPNVDLFAISLLSPRDSLLELPGTLISHCEELLLRCRNCTINLLLGITIIEVEGQTGGGC